MLNYFLSLSAVSAVLLQALPTSISLEVQFIEECIGIADGISVFDLL